MGKEPYVSPFILTSPICLSLYLLRFTTASNGVKDTTTVENVSGEILKKIVDLNIPEPDEILDGEVQKDESASKSVGLTAAGDVSPVDDVQKKIQRAERFGVFVKLTEEEKRNSHAERYD